MPRPQEIAEEQARRWIEKGRRDRKGVQHFREVPEEVDVCGNWLHMKLLALGADVATANKVCFANGQRLAMVLPGGDHWIVTLRTLERFKAGDIDEPGEELGRRLLEERYGGVGPRTVVRFLKEQKVDMSFLDEIVRDLTAKYGRTPTAAEAKEEFSKRYPMPEVPK